jgi:hypothetical protein
MAEPLNLLAREDFKTGDPGYVLGEGVRLGDGVRKLTDAGIPREFILVTALEDVTAWTNGHFQRPIPAPGSTNGHVGRSHRDRTMLEGDILVTAVGEHYAIGRLKADHDTQESLGWQLDRTEAVKQACALAGANHRVFLYASAGTSYYLPFDCADVSK